MKKFSISLVAVLLPFLSTLPSSVSAAQGKKIPAELSALLLSPSYALTVSSLVKQASGEGLSLKIVEYSRLALDPAIYVYVDLYSRVTAELNGRWTPYGQIVGEIGYGPQGEISVNSAYFKPIRGLPVIRPSLISR